MKKIILTCALGIVYILAIAQTPMAAYKFTDGTFYDVAGSHYDAIATKGFSAISDAWGNPNSAVQGVPGGYIEIGDNDAFSFVNNPITISLWLKMNNQNTWTGLVNKWGVTGGYYLGVNPDNNSVRFNIVSDFVEDTQPITPDTWTHFTASYDGNSIKMYRNGVLVNQTATTIGIAPSTNIPFRIGMQSNLQVATVHTSSLDEVLVFDTALTDMEIENLYNNGTTMNTHDIAMVHLENSLAVRSVDNIDLVGEIMNLGSETLESFDLYWSNGVDTFSQNFSGLAVLTDAHYAFSIDDVYPIAVGEVVDLEVWVQNPNGVADLNMVNNNLTANVTGLSFMPTKKVFVVDGTSTELGNCPFGIVGMEFMTDNYSDDFIGVTVHAEDVMTMSDFNSGFPGIPLARLDNIGVDFVNPFALNLEIETTARHNNSFAKASITPIVTTSPNDPRQMTVEVSSTFALPLNTEHRLNVYVIENNVVGTDESYNQANAFVGNAFGPMGGFESLPNPVPFDQMVYNLVARAALGNELGTANSLPANIIADEEYTFSYEYTLPDEFNLENIEVVAFIIDSNSGEILNAEKTTYSDFTVATSDVLSQNERVDIFPNPASNMTNVVIDLEEKRNASIRLMSPSGILLSQQDLGLINGWSQVELSTANLAKGFYFVQIELDNQVVTRKLVVL